MPGEAIMFRVSPSVPEQTVTVIEAFFELRRPFGSRGRSLGIFRHLCHLGYSRNCP